MAKRVQDLPNQSYKTQQDNESEVERIMRERGYERSSKTRHLRGEKRRNQPSVAKRIFATVAFIAIPVAMLALPFISMSINSLQTEMKEKLKSCLEKAGTVEMTEIISGDKIFDDRIECYNKYNVQGFEKEIAKLEDQKAASTDAKKLSVCLEDAEENYGTTEEEADLVKTTSDLLMYLKRRNLYYEAELSCYNKYGHGNYDDVVDKLDALVKQNNSDIPVLEEKVKAQNSSPRYCDIHAYGSTAHAECY